jgi:hypothetical protein
MQKSVADEAQRILTQVAADHKQYMAVKSGRWATDEDRREVTRRLQSSVAAAKQTAAPLEDTKDPVSYEIYGSLVKEFTMAEHILAHPEMLMRR